MLSWPCGISDNMPFNIYPNSDSSISGKCAEMFETNGAALPSLKMFNCAFRFATVFKNVSFNKSPIDEFIIPGNVLIILFSIPRRPLLPVH